MSWFVDKIKSRGTPVIIAGDKNRSGDVVNKLVAIFNAQAYNPRYDISVKKKRDLSAGVKHVENAHQRDAFASAMTAYNAYSSRFVHAEKMALKKNYADIEKVKAMTVMRHSVHEIMTEKKVLRYRNRFI